MKKTINGVTFIRSVSGVWYSPNNAYSVSRHDTLRTKYTLRGRAGIVIQHDNTIGKLLAYAAKLFNAAEAAEAEAANAAAAKKAEEETVVSVSVSESEVSESVQSLQENLLLSRCESLSAALKRLDRLTNEFTEFKTTMKRGKKQRRKQGELLLSAVGCLRLSVMTLSAALKQRRDIVQAYKNQATRIQQRAEQSRETVLRAKTYRTNGMFKRTEVDYNEDKSVSESLSVLQSDVKILRDILILNQSGLRIVSILNYAESLVNEFCRLRSVILDNVRKDSGKNQTQNKLLSVLSASEHSDKWRNKKNDKNTIAGVNGKLLDSVDVWPTMTETKLQESKICPGLQASGLRVVRATIEKQGSKTSRVSIHEGQRIIDNTRHTKRSWWNSADRLHTSWFPGYNPEKVKHRPSRYTQETETASEYQWYRQTFNLQSELQGSIPAVHPLTRFAASLGLLPGEDSPESVLVRDGEHSKLRSGGDIEKLRFLLRLRKAVKSLELSDSDRVRNRLKALQRLRERTVSAVCLGGVSQVVVSSPVPVGSILLTDSESGESVSLPIVRFDVVCYGSSENVEYTIAGDVPEFWGERLSYVSRHGNYRNHVTTWHAVNGTVKDTQRIPRNMAEIREDMRDRVQPSPDATETDVQGLIVILSRCLENQNSAAEIVRDRQREVETPADARKRQRKEKAAFLLRLLRLQSVSVSDSLSSGNCKAGTSAFMQHTLRLSESVQSISGSELARRWKASGYVQSSLFERVIQTAEQRQAAESVPASV